MVLILDEAVKKNVVYPCFWWEVNRAVKNNKCLISTSKNGTLRCNFVECLFSFLPLFIHIHRSQEAAGYQLDHKRLP